ncbi:MAG TPA: exodeoxyribonuclease V subunit beta [Accumulibacter sp.]|uniref:exodeoxyribonuclease V subunit beta n=1 Tax=Accumulibacter sp. TaxID=2053492 RepID=UPI002D04D2BA|nr:exodeoxyribonuclease V subunit beta [Accumulibacter sp.]HRF74254.1 exodeoxyribonuclease V subunit beta [Accumulibacter sp.]
MSATASPALAEPAPNPLNPLRFPLCGSQLIEASAGTGKTFTIAALYLRLILGHGDGQGDGRSQAAAFTRPLTPPEILVVTFTEAATKELRERIRARLAEAAGYFLADPEAVAASAPGDGLLHDLRADYLPEQWPACARSLQLAAEWMDEAAVSTIHSWCNRMLREHAFDSGSLFTQELEADQSELLAEVVRDYWRKFMVPLDAAAVEEVLRWWSGPLALQASLRNLLGHAGLFPPVAEPAGILARVLVERAAMLDALKKPWQQWLAELRELLDAARERKAFDGVQLKKNNYDAWLVSLAEWRDDRQRLRPALSDRAMERLSEDGLRAIWKKGAPPQHPALRALARLESDLADLPDARNDLLRHAVRWIDERFGGEQQRRAQMGFDDLLKRLAAALGGPNGARLAERIRLSFPVALIDEFQDTDPVQYSIFDSIYRLASNDRSTALILIGDPKQAIYSFRGADIHTYLVARRACAGRLHTLQRNFRSTAPMVIATNRCFELAEARAGGAGAFLFRTAEGNPVPFVAAAWQGRQDALKVDGVAPPALTAWWLAPAQKDGRAVALTGGAYFEQMAAACATEMVRLLNRGQAGAAALVSGEQARSLRPADLAVLVNTRREATAIRSALAARGVRSVYLSDRESVLRTAQAAEVQRWLAACAEPDDPRLLRAALATPTLALSWEELDTLNHDERAWEARLLQFRNYRECWRRQGVLPMLRRFLNDFQLPARLVADGAYAAARPVAPDGTPEARNGERVLTDLLHLAELLQEASGLLDGEHALIRHLAEQRQEAARAGGAASGGGSGDVRQIRLESDADLVQVVTVHKAKGLEYPLVFFPFAGSFRETKANDLPLKYHDGEGHLLLALDASDESVQRADRERLGEDLRKLYVALTRARYATWVGLAPLAGLEKSAFGYLLAGGEAIAVDALEASLNTLRGDCRAISVAPAPESSAAVFTPQGPATTIGGARKSCRVARERWWIASYSALRTIAGEPHAVAETAGEDVFREALQGPEAMAATSPADAPGSPGSGSLHAFPRGAEAGTFLHDLLEWAARQGFAAVAANRPLLRDTVARRCNARGWAEWIDVLTAWIEHFLQTKLPFPADRQLPEARFSLAGLRASSAEMEFWVEVHAVDTASIDRLVCAHTLAGAARPMLQPGQLNGMLKGFIDLVFEHHGRYYVADYKSNWLGPDDAAYTAEAMRAAILHSRYELQYALYLLAVHRLLKLRLADYDYDRHVGGAVYLFLRGSRSPGQGVHHERPPRALIEALDALFSSRTVGGSA